MGTFEHFWALLSTFERFWALLRTFEHFWALLSTFEHFWALLSAFEHFWALLRTFELFYFWALFSTFEQFYCSVPADSIKVSPTWFRLLLIGFCVQSTSQKKLKTRKPPISDQEFFEFLAKKKKSGIKLTCHNVLLDAPFGIGGTRACVLMKEFKRQFEEENVRIPVVDVPERGEAGGGGQCEDERNRAATKSHFCEGI